MPVAAPAKKKSPLFAGAAAALVIAVAVASHGSGPRTDQPDDNQHTYRFEVETTKSLLYIAGGDTSGNVTINKRYPQTVNRQPNQTITTFTDGGTYDPETPGHARINISITKQAGVVDTISCKVYRDHNTKPYKTYGPKKTSGLQGRATALDCIFQSQG